VSAKKKKRYRKVLGRRTFLRGAGTVAIGLPFVDAMTTTSLYAAMPEPPVRAFNVFFGLGFPTPLQAEDWTGPLEALEPLRDRLCVIRGIDQYRNDIGGVNAHYDGSGSCFSATKVANETRRGGATLDQVLRRAAYPDGLPTGMIPTLAMGTYFRRADRPYRYLHSWNADGSPAAQAIDDPRDLFDRIFGSAEPEPTDTRDQRLRQSVLDSVLEQYRHYQSDASNLGVASRAKIADHLDRIREHEVRVFGDGTDGGTCTEPSRPPRSDLPLGAAADPGGEGVDVTLDGLVDHWRLMSDLYALAIHCDRVRFGCATYMSAGERIRMTGRYEFEGRHIYDFDDRADRGGRSGAQGCSHEFWHGFSADRENAELRAHLHLKLREVAYFLDKLDDPEHRDANGLSVLQNAMVTVSTESGDGRHNDVRRELSGIFHAISGANERFVTGDIVDVAAEGIDLYNTMLAAMGTGEKVGDPGRPVETVGAILR